MFVQDVVYFSTIAMQVVSQCPPIPMPMQLACLQQHPRCTTSSAPPYLPGYPPG